jgi:Trypsin
MKRLKARGWAVVGAVSALLISSPRSEALMAGVSPDTPAARVDPNEATSPYAGVGSVIVGEEPLSGVVIASQFVLTAGHVAAGQPASAIQFALNLGGAQWLSAVTSVTTYPSYSFPYDDLAVLKLATPVPAGVPVYPVYSGAFTTGSVITLVGYGGSGNGNVGVTVGASSSVKRTGTNSVDAFATATDTSGRLSRFFLYDFDAPTGSGSLGGSTTGNASETVVAVGDSGGPSFIRSGNELQLFGINTFVSPPSGSTSVNYEFGTIGGGIVASDPRFTAWLESATEGTLGNSTAGDVPLPWWAGGLLAAVLAALLIRHSRRREAG